MLLEILDAVAGCLTEKWPERKVRVNEVPDDAVGHYFLMLETPQAVRELDRRRLRSVTVSIVYTTAAHNNMDYLAWVDEMFEALEDVPLRGRPVHATNAHAEQMGRDWHFLFDLDLRGLWSQPPAKRMAVLESTDRIKERET